MLQNGIDESGDGISRYLLMDMNELQEADSWLTAGYPGVIGVGEFIRNSNGRWVRSLWSFYFYFKTLDTSNCNE